jgi:hypothetical protein
MRAQGGIRGIAPLILNLDARWGCVVKAGRFTPDKEPVPIVQEAGLAKRPLWTGVVKKKYFVPNGVRTTSIQFAASGHTDYAIAVPIDKLRCNLKTFC